MLASKSDQGSSDFDTFNCLNCKAVISLAPVPTAAEPGSHSQ
jgi:hypothetical protein